MNYAPIIIPTCNRIIHLKRLIESLNNNNWAKYTDLYISVDFPPNEGFAVGHEEVVRYVKQIEGFKSNTIFFQSNNLGPYKNVDFLLNEISKKYDRFIFLEDDNEVSTNFIEYMDKMLERFKDDSSVYAICAKNDETAERGNGTYYMRQFLSPYGVGFWVTKYNEMKSFVNGVYFKNIGKSITKCIKLWMNSELQFNYYAGYLLGENSPILYSDMSVAHTDVSVTIALILNNMRCIYPIKNTSRNWGNDGTGVHSRKQENIENVSEKELDEDTGFRIEEGTQQEVIFLKQNRHARKIRKMTIKSNVWSWSVVMAKMILPVKLFDSIKHVFF